MSFEVLVALVLLALAFDFMNGFHDAANSIATVVSTRVLRLHYAVAWAATFNFVAFLFFGLHVANTIGKGIIDPVVADHVVVFGALVGAIAWNVITWWFGIPSSSSHALIGGPAGAAVAKAGFGALVASGFLLTSVAIVASPVLGMVLGSGLMIAAWIFRRSTPARIDRWFRRLGSSFPPASTAWATVATTPRRPWASSRCCCFPRERSVPPFTFPGW